MHLRPLTKLEYYINNCNWNNIPYATLLPHIHPYPLSDEYLSSEKEVFRERVKLYDFEEEDLKIIPKGLLPEIITEKNGVTLTFIISWAWEDSFWSSKTWDFLSKDVFEKLNISLDDLYRISIENLAHDGIDFDEYDPYGWVLGDFHIYKVGYDYPLYPANNCALLLYSTIWGTIFDVYNTPYYVFPKFRDPPKKITYFIYFFYKFLFQKF